MRRRGPGGIARRRRTTATNPRKPPGHPVGIPRFASGSSDDTETGGDGNATPGRLAATPTRAFPLGRGDAVPGAEPGPSVPTRLGGELACTRMILQSRQAAETAAGSGACSPAPPVVNRGPATYPGQVDDLRQSLCQVNAGSPKPGAIWPRPRPRSATPFGLTSSLTRGSGRRVRSQSSRSGPASHWSLRGRWRLPVLRVHPRRPVHRFRGRCA